MLSSATQVFFKAVSKAARALNWLAGASLVFLMLLTICDVAGRAFGKPIRGTMELAGYAGGLAIGLAMPFTSWVRGHVYVDSFVMRLPQSAQRAVHIATRLLGASLFVVLGWNLFRVGLKLRNDGTVSQTLEMPFYPVLFGIGLASFIHAIVLLCDIAADRRGADE